MSSFGFNTGLRALLASQFMLDTVGHNISNANVDGYTRQRVELGAALPIGRGGLFVGTGVNVRGVQRSVDNILSRRIIEQTSITGGLETQLLNLREIETLFNEPEGVSLGGRFDGFFDAISQLTGDPSNSILRTGAVQSGVEVASQFNQLAGGIDRISRTLYDEIEVQVNRMNQLASEIGQLNQEIGEALRTGLEPNDLLDQQERAIQAMAEIADVRLIRGDNGIVRVLAGGSTLVGTSTVQAISTRRLANGEVEFAIEGATRPLGITGGQIGAITELAQNRTPELLGDLDQMASNLILEFNRVHSTGLPANGPFSSLTATNGFQDMDGDGTVLDERISQAGLPFEVTEGAIYVNVENLDDGRLSRTRIDIDPNMTTVEQFVEAMNDIPNLTASLDGLGRLQVTADSGFGFDFSGRIDEIPDRVGAFGGGFASLGTPMNEPFNLADGQTLSFQTPTGTANFTLDSADFDDIGNATAQEIADVLNADAAFGSAGLVANAQGGALYVQTATRGESASFQITGGTAASALGWATNVGQTITGHDDQVDVELSGSYTGDVNEQWSFRPNMDGVIGTTPGLSVEVFDSNGTLIASLDVSDKYTPGAPIAVANGIEVSFGLGEISAEHNDQFTTTLLSDSDSTDLLAAAGINAFFVGSDARTIGVRSDIELNSDLFASSGTGAVGDTSQLLLLGELESMSAAGLGDRSLGSFYGRVIGDLGTDVNRAQTALESSDSLMSSLQDRRNQVSGVNVDEELVDMLRFEQAFQAASRYIATLNDLNDDIMGLL